MAFIKTFKGQGPNPNVPFAGDMPRPQFIGQTENAVSRLTKNVTGMSLDYMETQRKQKDAADVAKADRAKSLFQSELDGDQSLYQPNGNIDLEQYNERLNAFYEEVKPTMSSDAYKRWKNTQTVLDGRKLGSLSTENMKRTRQANQADYLSSLEVMASNSTVGSFEDMEDTRYMIQQSVEDGIESQFLSPKEATQLENDLLRKTAKSYVDNLEDSVKGYGVSSDQVNKAYDSAVAFVESDPYGVYRRDQGLKSSTIATLKNNRMNQVRRKQEEALRIESLEDRARKQRSDKVYSGLQEEAYSLYSVQEDHRKIADFNRRVLQQLQSGVISDARADRLLNYNVNMVERVDDSKINTVVTLADTDSALKYISSIQNPKKREKAVEVSRIPEPRKNILSRILDKGSNTQKAIDDFIITNKAFDAVLENNENMQYTDRDLEMVEMLKHLDRDERADESMRYNMYLRERFPRMNVSSVERTRMLRNKLQEQYRLMQQQQQGSN